MGLIYKLTCSKCNLSKSYYGPESHLVRAYVSSEDDVFRLNHQDGYCRPCNAIRDIESLDIPFDHTEKILSIESSIAELSRQKASRSLIKKIFSSWRDLFDNRLALMQVELASAYLYKQKREDFYSSIRFRQKRCLTCASTECAVLEKLEISNNEAADLLNDSYNSDSASGSADQKQGWWQEHCRKHAYKSYTAPHIGCGGKLTLAPDDLFFPFNAPARPISYRFYNEEGVEITESIELRKREQRLIKTINDNSFF